MSITHLPIDAGETFGVDALTPLYVQFSEHYEANARLLQVSHGWLVPGIVQTPDYMRTIYAGKDPEQGQALFDARHERQRVFSKRQNEVRLQVLIGEAALRDESFSEATMAEQLSFLASLAAGANERVEARLAPYGKEMPPDIQIAYGDGWQAVFENSATEHVLKLGKPDTRASRELFDTAWQRALPPEQTAEYLRHF